MAKQCQHAEGGAHRRSSDTATISPMPTKFHPTSPRYRLLFLSAVLVGLSACSPTYDWREVHGSDAPYVALLPGKPVSHSRPIDLDGIALTMSMTAAQVEGRTFAIGSARLPDAAQAPKALQAMKTAMVRNISGTITREQASTLAGQAPVIDVEATGTPPSRDGQSKPALLLVARFVAKDDRVYQVVAIGPERNAPREEITTFLAGFKLK
jgi:hypothetical protein